MKDVGFTLKGEDHPIVPVMLEDVRLVMEFVDNMRKESMSLGSASRSCQKEKLTFKSINLSSVSKYDYQGDFYFIFVPFPLRIQGYWDYTWDTL